MPASAIDRIHAAAVRNPLLLRLTIGTRVLLAIGFFAPGLTKLLGSRFVSAVTDDPVGVFFESLYQTGLYWRFLGAAQVLAAVLVLFRQTTALGALLFFGIILNVFVITVSLPFGNTAIVAGLMLLASVYLVAWDYPRWKPLFADGTTVPAAATIPRLESAGYAAVVLGGWGVTCVMRGIVTRGYLAVFWISAAIAACGALLVLAAWIRGVVRAKQA